MAPSLVNNAAAICRSHFGGADRNAYTEGAMGTQAPFTRLVSIIFGVIPTELACVREKTPYWRAA
jgi:hypothetical protein